MAQQYFNRSQSDERFIPPDRASIADSNQQHLRPPQPGPKEEKKRGFWSSSKDKDRPREVQSPPRDPRSQQPDDHDLTRKIGELAPSPRTYMPKNITESIGYLTATASEDFTLVYDVCDRASANEANAKEAVRALRREFKYGEPPAQLSAARLWAIMLHNSSPIFVVQSRSRKFLETIEDLLTSPRTSPVVRERLLDVVGAAAYATRHHPRPDGFQSLWRRVKPIDKPEEGVPFDTEDAMFNPAPPSRLSHYEAPHSAQPSPTPQIRDAPPSRTPPPPVNPPRRRKSPTRNRIIPLEEDIRRLMQECKIGQGNASLLSQALVNCQPEEVQKSEIINEFILKCRSSQELIYAQIPWATAQAERSRVARDQDNETRKRNNEPQRNGKAGDDETIEEKLLGNLLAANGELIEALRQYDDLVRIAEERKAEEISRREVRMDRRAQEVLAQQGEYVGGSVASRSPSPSVRSYSPSRGSNFSHSRHQYYQQSQNDHDIDYANHPNLAPPPNAPHGPRSPGQFSIRSRTPSLNGHDQIPHSAATVNGHVYNGGEYHHRHQDSNSASYHQVYGYRDEQPADDYGSIYEDEDGTPMRPSAKALGKRKVVDPGPPDSPNHADDTYFDVNRQDRNSVLDDRFGDSDSESLIEGQPADNNHQQPWHQRPVQYVYDAAAERTQQRLLEAQKVYNEIHGAPTAMPPAAVNGVH
ncbi:hypothetical protein H1R20_g906, partial [Candolleomyces eurysporus]